MKKLKLFFACLLMAVLSIGQVWATGTLVSALGDISDGETYYIAALNSDKYYTVPNTTINAQTFTCAEGSLSGSTLTPADGAGEFVFTAVDGVNNAYYIYNTNLEKYLVATASKKFGYVDNTSGDYGYWTFSAVSSGGFSGAFSVQHTASGQNKTQYIRAYNNSVRCYDGASNNGIYLFQKESGGGSSVTAPTLDPNGGNFVGSQSVTLAQADSKDIYYTTNGDDPTTSGSLYTAPFTLTATTTVKAAAQDGSAWSDVVSKTFTKLDELTTMDGIFAKATAVGGTATDVSITFNNWVVTGVKNSNAYVTDGTKGFIIYTASHGFNVGDILSGTAVCKVQLYNGSAELTELTASKVTVNTGGTVSVNELDAEGIAALTGANTGSLIKISGECTSETVNTKTYYYVAGVQLYNTLFSFTVSAGTSYDCTGVYVYYKKGTDAAINEIAPRSAADIVETSTIAVTGVTLTESTASIEAGDNVTLHATVEPSTATNKNIVWSVESGSDYASVADGVVTGIAAGEAVIRATSAENASIYDECTVTVSAADPTKHKVTFAATIDIAETGVLTLTKDNVTMTITGGTLENGTDYRCYKNQTLTLECSVGNVIKIEFTGVSGKPVSNFADPAEGTLETEGNDGVWTGDAASVAFTASTDQVRATLIKVTYKEDTRAESGLAWDPADDIEITVGDAFTAPTLSNPNSIAAAEIYIESSNTDLAIISEGVPELVENATGTTTITATFAGNETYKPATVSYNITVNGGALTDYYEKATSVVEGTYLIVYEAGNVALNGALGYDNDHKIDVVSNTIAVDITNDHKIAVTSATEASTFYIDPTAGSIQAASGKYIGVTAHSNGLSSSDNAIEHKTLSIDASGNAEIVVGTNSGDMTLLYNSASNQTRFRYFTSTSQQAIQLYKLANEVIKPASGLAWDPADDIEITVGGAFSAPTLLNPNNIDAADITIESSNTDLATVTAGVVELVADATGSATITATYTGTTYKPITVSYKIKVNPAASIYVSPSLNVNFGSVVKDAALPANKTITVTLNNVAAATATLGGTNPEAFSITPDALTESGDITISVIASTAAAATYSATITITDDANVAAEKVVNLSFAVTEPAAEETPVSTTSKWVPATEITDGMQVLITGVKSDVTYAMGAASSNGNNRTSVAGSLDEGVFTPGENTMPFTLVATGAVNTYYIKTSNNQYLYNASTSGNSYLRTKAEQENVSWTITLDGDGNAVITSVENTNRTLMRLNPNGQNNPLFNCYASGQNAIKLYVPQTPEPPTPTYTAVREGLTAGNYYTICYPKTMNTVTGATLWSFVGKEEGLAYIQQESAPFAAGKPYLMYATAATVQAVLEGDAVTTAGSNGALHGTFENLVQEQLDGFGDDVYLVIGNELRRATGAGTGSNTLPANRAYVKLSEISEGAPAHAPGKNIRTMPMHKDATTAIDNAEASDAPRKVMIDGALFIIRGEKAYDATGRLVK